MSTRTAFPTFDIEESTLRGGAAAGGVAAVVMAGIMAVLPPLRPVLFGAIPGLYGLAPPASPVAGVVIHVVHGAIFGVAFTALLQGTGLGDHAESLGKLVGLGLGYGILVWIVGAVILMPLWLQAIGFPKAPPFPNVKPPILLLHLVYGAVLGGAFGIVGEW